MEISRWVTMDRLCWWMYSMGSSIVMIWASLVWLILSIRQASVVDFPDPAEPVISTRPFFPSADRIDVVDTYP